MVCECFRGEPFSERKWCMTDLVSVGCGELPECCGNLDGFDISVHVVMSPADERKMV